MIEKIFKASKNDAEKRSKTNIQNTQNVQILAPILEPFAWLFPGVARFSRDLFFGTSGGTPLDRCWPPLGTLGHILLTFCNIARATFLKISKIPEQQITPTTPRKKQARISEQLYR